MSLKDNMKQIPVIVPERIKELLEEDAKDNNNSRSGIACKILIDHYKKEGKYKD
jgi:hypothetical protein